MKRLVAIIGLIAAFATHAQAQYIDGAPQATLPLNSASIMPLCQGGTPGRPGTCKPFQTTVGTLTLNPIGAFNLKQWTTATRPSPVAAGALGFNTSLSSMDLWNGTAWQNPSGFLGGAVPNATSFSASGTALTVTNNALFQGNTTIQGVGTFSGTTAAFGSNAGAGFLTTINGAVSTNRRILGQTAGSTRWEMRMASPDAESGSNVGSYWELLPYTDAGTLEGTSGLIQCRRDTYGCQFGNAALPLASQTQIGPLINLNVSLAGSTTAAGQSLFNTVIGNDILTATNSPRDWQLLHNFGGAGFAGGRIGLLTVMTQIANITATGLPIIEGIQSSVSLNNTWGGTDLTLAGQAGTATALNPFLTFNCNTPVTACYTNGGGGSGAEFDFHFDSGVTFRAVAGILFARLGTGPNASVGQGAVADSTIQISDGSTTTGHWLTNLQISSRDSNWPLDATKGRIVFAELGNSYQSLPNAALDGFHLLNVTFSGNAFITRGTAIDGSGTYRNGTAYQTFTAGSGLGIDVQGYEGQPETTSLTVSAAGTLWPTSGQFYATDTCNGVYSLTMNGTGGVAAAVVYRVAYCPTNPGSTVTLVPDRSAAIFGATGATVTNAHTQAGSGSPVLTLGGTAAVAVAGSGSKIGFYGATPIVKATPSGACAGNTGCQALRDALGNLGLINTGSITN